MARQGRLVGAPPFRAVRRHTSTYILPHGAVTAGIGVALEARLAAALQEIAPGADARRGPRRGPPGDAII